MRNYTEDEINQANQAEDALVKNGFVRCASNQNIIAEHFEQHPEIPLTISAVYGLVESRKSEFKWNTPVKTALNNLTKEQRTSLLAWFNHQQQLETHGDPGDRNLLEIVGFLQRNSWEFTNPNFNKAVAHVQSSPGGWNKFVLKRRQQDRQIEDAQPKPAITVEKDTTEYPAWLKPHNRAHWKMVHSQPEKPKQLVADSGNYWQNRATTALNALRSNNDRIDGQKVFNDAMRNGNPEFAFFQLSRWMEQRTAQRSGWRPAKG